MLLSAYIAVGAPLASYVPGLQGLTAVVPKEIPLTKAQIERMEREALRKEMEAEFEQAMMEDKVIEAEHKAKQDKIDAALREKEEAEQAKSGALSRYSARIEAAKGRITEEPADGVLLRLRCPDGHQLTRKFSRTAAVESLYDYIDVERYKKASKVTLQHHFPPRLSSCENLCASQLHSLATNTCALSYVDRLRTRRTSCWSSRTWSTHSFGLHPPCCTARIARL